ncbi:uncharacterized protein LOC116026894 [Ipomoea triloba]|uniref:uncharacterized protein LOC116026894 n=1 Tax=Ipomoea triloba TaxID=35885 RepID=UPI00125D15FD|nr:uncharacterized protein LOC116026894 [Ipomoea triloba]
MSILSDIFCPEDVERISSIPISPEYEDTWFWYGDPKGCYSVKDGYRSILGDFVGPSGGFDKWNYLWKIKVPPKWRTFMWRALSDTLPVTTNLLLKRVEVDPLCPMCGLSHENVMHALVLCEFSSIVWQETNLPVFNVLDGSFVMWFMNLLLSLTEENLAFGVAVLYSIWSGRNSAVWENCLPRPRSLVTQAVAVLHAWRGVHHGALNQPIPAMAAGSSSATVGGVQSPTGLRRCFFDAGHRPTTQESTFAVVLLETGGQFIAACAGRLPVCFSPFMAEAEACKAALV